jgi:prenyltransferase beta subunit
MSLRLEMLQVARLAPKLLEESSALVRGFLESQQNADGGFKDRIGKSDLYYTVFGIDGLLALQADLPLERIENYLRTFANGEHLDFVHLCCLARCWGAIEHTGSRQSLSPNSRSKIVQRIEEFRTEDGGYHPATGSAFGTAYGSFLALGAYQDLKLEFPEPLRLVQCLKFLETNDGAWTNERTLHSLRAGALSEPEAALRTPHLNTGSTNATAAAVTVLRNLGLPVSSTVGDWLLARAHPEGGFLAATQAPIPDLLSTATALHALAGLERDFTKVKEPCLDFIDTLWTNEGAFHGNWSDDVLDCEYTYYGLLALGHLSL